MIDCKLLLIYIEKLIVCVTYYMESHNPYTHIFIVFVENCHKFILLSSLFLLRIATNLKSKGQNRVRVHC
jgi:hypothetical protein